MMRDVVSDTMAALWEKFDSRVGRREQKEDGRKFIFLYPKLGAHSLFDRYWNGSGKREALGDEAGSLLTELDQGQCHSAVMMRGA